MGTVDLAALDSVQASNLGAEIEILHPVTGEGLGQYIRVVGKDSDQFRSFQRRKFNEMLRNEKLSKRRMRENTKTAEDYEEDLMDLLVACTTGWRGVVYQGKELEFNPENVRMLYEKMPWLRDQVNDEIGDLGNFLTQPKKSS